MTTSNEPFISTRNYVSTPLFGPTSAWFLRHTRESARTIEIVRHELLKKLKPLVELEEMNIWIFVRA